MSKELYEKIEHKENGEESLEELLARINSEGYEDPDFKPFTVTSDIGKDDYRAFFYYSIIGKTPVLTAVSIAAPLIAAGVIAYDKGNFNVTAFAFWGILFYLLVAALVILRAELTMNKIKKNTPEVLRLTKTIYNFKTNAIFYTKNDATITVPFKNFLRIIRTKERYFLYFSGQKAMVIRTEDIKEVMPLKEFDKFINSKVKEM